MGIQTCVSSLVYSPFSVKVYPLINLHTGNVTLMRLQHPPTECSTPEIVQSAEGTQSGLH